MGGAATPPEPIKCKELLELKRVQATIHVACQALGRQMMTKYTAMCQALAKHVKFNAPSPVGPPQGSPLDGQQLTAVVQRAAPSMPRKYASAYAIPLAKGLPSL